ncbi:MAG: phage GP46 family protein [Deltaproteobacteria bacterium]|nr:phage GP46 family protein [Deltaproteobacteria bacterium]
MDFALDIVDRNSLAGMTFEKATTIMNNIYLSLTIEQGSFFADTTFGSRLHLLRRAKNTETTARLAVDYCREALQWLLDTKKAIAIDVFAQRDRTQDIHRLKLLIEVTPISGPIVPFTTFIDVV